MLELRFAISVLLFCSILNNTVYSQSRLLVHKMDLPISQNTNNNILRHKDVLYASSMDGLNVIKGQKSSVIRYTKGHSSDNNIQSSFYVLDGRIWYTIHSAICMYDIQHMSLDCFKVHSSHIDSIASGYKIIGTWDDLIYLTAGYAVMSFDTKSKEVLETWAIDSCEECIMKVVVRNNQPVLYIGNELGLSQNKLSASKDTLGHRSYMLKRPIEAIIVAHGSIWIATSTNELFELSIDGEMNTIELPISATDLISYSEGIIINYDNSFSFYDTGNTIIGERITLYDPKSSQRITDILHVSIDTDSIMWVSSDGNGLYYCDLKKEMRDFMRLDEWVYFDNTLAIVPNYTGASLLAFTSNTGIAELSMTGDVLQFITHDQYGSAIDSRIAVQYEHGAIYANTKDQSIQFVEPRSSRITTLSDRSLESDKRRLYQLKRLSSGRIVGCARGEGVGTLSIDLANNEYSFNVFAHSCGTHTEYTYFHEGANGQLYLSYNEDEIHVYHPSDSLIYEYTLTLPLAGGVWGFFQYPKDTFAYIGNSQGLFRIHTETCDIEPLFDSSHITRFTYCVVGDSLNNLWLSKNDGIWRYSILDGSMRQFSEKDGVSSREFNAHCMYADGESNIYFGGTNGITKFNPYKISPSKTNATVDVFGFKINDEVSSKYRIPNSVDTIDLDFKDNTLSFEFQAIDYSDPASTRVKYKMSYYDNAWVETPTSLGFARYANMRPGTYLFSLVGANADGFYSDQIKSIYIRIRAPFYLTWWFYVIIASSVLGIVYLTLLAKYRRKMERKELQLREQSLVIEKQKAVQNERNRIASEMHDDLGSGLTTIKFLSDRAVKYAKNEKEATNIKRIAEHSNRLVSNMSEIIWAMNSRFDTADCLVGYIRRHASEFLEGHDLPLEFLVRKIDNLQVTGEKRRNISLTIKELLNNTVRYSNASSIHIEIRQEALNIVIIMREINGIGFDLDEAVPNGNGLFNVQKRISDVGGRIKFLRSENEMSIIILLPCESNRT